MAKWHQVLCWFDFKTCLFQRPCSKCLEELKCSITELISLTCWLKQLFSIFSTSIVRERICSSLHFDSPLFDQVSSIYFFHFALLIFNLFFQFWYCTASGGQDLVLSFFINNSYLRYYIYSKVKPVQEPNNLNATSLVL